MLVNQHGKKYFLTTGSETQNLQNKLRKKKNIAERGFDPRTSGLWAQHASTAPLCYR